MAFDIIKVITNEQALEKYSDRNRLLEEAIPYIGQPRQSASDLNKIFLRVNPMSGDGTLLEFHTDDIVFAENLENVTNKDGATYQIVKIWIRIGSIGIKLEPFSVQDYSHVLNKDLGDFPNEL